MAPLQPDLDSLAAETRFSGVVRVDRGGDLELERAYGLAHRGLGVPNEADTRFAIASGGKGLTALTMIRLVADGMLALGTPARSLLGDDLPLIGDAVTLEHLLAHRSGIGDYVDEDLDVAIDEYVLPVPVHELATTEGFLAVLDGHSPKFAADERFSYCNGGYVVLALLAERVAGVPFHDLVHRSVCEPAGLAETSFLRSDEPPGGVALGYLEADGLRTNVLHLPVRGSGDGGVYSTVADVRAFWTALFMGEIVSPEWLREMTRPRSDVPGRVPSRYGLGFWLDATSSRIWLEGYDAGVSFRSTHDPETDTTWTVVSNTSEGAWPVVRLLGAGQAG